MTPNRGDVAPRVVLTSAVDGSRVDLGAAFSAHDFTVLLIDGAAPTSDIYKRFIGLALEISARWGNRVLVYIVTSRNERPFEVPCEVGILFDDGGELAATYGGTSERGYVINAEGIVTLRVESVETATVLTALNRERS